MRFFSGSRKPERLAFCVAVILLLLTWLVTRETQFTPSHLQFYLVNSSHACPTALFWDEDDMFDTSILPDTVWSRCVTQNQALESVQRLFSSFGVLSSDRPVKKATFHPFVSLDQYSRAGDKLHFSFDQFNNFFNCIPLPDQDGFAYVRKKFPEGLRRSDLELSYRVSEPDHPHDNAFHIQFVDNEFYMRMPFPHGHIPTHYHNHRVIMGFIDAFQELLRIVDVPNVEFIFRHWACVLYSDLHLILSNDTGFGVATGHCHEEALFETKSFVPSITQFIRPYFNERLGSYPLSWRGGFQGMYDLLASDDFFRLHSWTEKIPKLFFRGACSSRYRRLLDDYFRTWNEPELQKFVDYGIVNHNGGFCKGFDGHLVPRAPEAADAEYRYLLALYGIGPIDRMPRLFATGSLVVALGPVLDPIYGEWWYKYLDPGVHYIQIPNCELHNDQLRPECYTSLLEFLQRLDGDDTWARKIANRGRKRVKELLDIRQTQCHIVSYLKESGSLLAEPVTVHSDAVRYVSRETVPCGSGSRSIDGWCLPYHSKKFPHRTTIFEHKIPIEDSLFQQR